MRFAIPSYKRSSLIIKNTLSTLVKCNVKLTDIDIFVSSEDERIDYETQIINKFFSEKINVINTSIVELHKRLNYILNEHYDEGQEVVLIEDDIRAIRRGKDTINIKEFCKQAFDTLRFENLYLWGISPTSSLMFHREGYTNDFKFILGTFYGTIVRKEKDLYVNNTYKQDWERSVLYTIKDKGVVRFNDLYCMTTYKTKKGGLGGIVGTDRLEKEINDVQYMISTYPDYCYQNSKKPNEIKFYQNKKVRSLLKTKTENVANLATSNQN